ncbi:zinc finger BED domain-containing protein RICESLEEPER 4-like [Tasmannia lanceolata]|uniref:zinc finger BED domain-containing protein RICESLEEPER 4-like n=1 Tax=Tasmannia lanceolata TaxID=3420 RepID=UPI004063914B
MSRSSFSDTLPSLVVDDINNNDADIDINDEETENASVAATTSTKRSRKSQQPRSAIWTHFYRKLKPNVDDVASGGESSLYGLNICKCNYCEKEYKCNSGTNGTSSLWKHLKVCKKKPQALASSGQSQLTFSMDKSGESSLTTWKFDHAAIKREMALMIMEGELPFKFLEQPRFRSLLKLLQPRFIPISRQTCRREVVNLYEGEKCKLKSYLRSSSQGICITTDTWTSNQEYNVSIARILEAIKFVRGSSSRTHKFRECVQMEGIQSKNLLCLDVCTRWNSTYFMLDAAEKFERAFARFECIEPQIKIDLEANNGVGTPTSSDWVAVRRLMVFLRYFYELTNKVSGTSFVTSSNFFQELTVLYDVLFDWKNGNDRDISSMASKMIEKCDKYWGGYSSKMNKLLFVAVVIDPWYKLKYVELAIKEMYQGAAGEVVAEVVKGLTYRLFDEYKNTISPASSVGQSSSLLERVVSDELSAKDRSRAKFRRLQSQVGGGANLTDLR